MNVGALSTSYKVFAFGQASVATSRLTMARLWNLMMCIDGDNDRIRYFNGFLEYEKIELGSWVQGCRQDPAARHSLASDTLFGQVADQVASWSRFNLAFAPTELPVAIEPPVPPSPPTPVLESDMSELEDDMPLLVPDEQIRRRDKRVDKLSLTDPASWGPLLAPAKRGRRSAVLHVRPTKRRRRSDLCVPMC